MHVSNPIYIYIYLGIDIYTPERKVTQRKTFVHLPHNRYPKNPPLLPNENMEPLASDSSPIKPRIMIIFPSPRSAAAEPSR
ncbi:hypothetical protein EYC80_000229 [Monilinia laxa]|uniref:Uncharacterized protein n=1 Tax=Monilinia laxa TaxID=61186 RepID=A0A5N6KA05_MONLA|nr:hypothetical protein EYC80_000229 [Monilinia laxa]